jgi:3-hydroxyisobutyrate dehydrogenase
MTSEATQDDRKPLVGIIGLGNMGGRVAARLLTQGFDVRGVDRRQGQGERYGVLQVDSLAGLGNAEVILLSLPDSAAVESVLLGGAGAELFSRDGLLVADLTTADPRSTARLAGILAGRGVSLVDAGVSGGPNGATAGTLTVMLGGNPEDASRLDPILTAISTHRFHLGPSGSGHAAKAVSNFLNAVNLAAISEAVVIGRASGLDPHQLLDVVNASSGRNWFSENRMPGILDGDFMPGSLSSILLAKDVSVYLSMAQDVRMPAFIGSSCHSLLALAAVSSRGSDSASRLFDLMSGWAAAAPEPTA